MKAYRLKHVPTGLYYQPHVHRGNNLSKKGKIYHRKPNIDNYNSWRSREEISLTINPYSQVAKIIIDKGFSLQPTREYFNSVFVTKKEDWVIEEILNN